MKITPNYSRWIKNNYELEIKNPKYNEVDKFHYYTRVDPKLFYKMKELNDKNRHYHNKFQSVIHDLIRIRNRIFKLQREWKRNDNPEDIGLTSENIVKFMEYTKSLEQTPEHDIFNSWSIIRKRKAESFFIDDDESVALTDSDVEDDQPTFNFI